MERRDSSSATHREHLDLGQGRGRGRSQLGVAVAAASQIPSTNAASSSSTHPTGGPPERRGRHREQARVELALGGNPGPRAIAAERLGDRRDHAELAGAVEVAASAPRPRPGNSDRPARPARPPKQRRSTPAAGTTSSRRQPFECPTSMYSMNRRTTPVSRAQRAIGTTLDSLIPRRTTMFTLIGGETRLARRRRCRRAPWPPGSRSRSSRRRRRHRASPG